MLEVREIDAGYGAVQVLRDLSPTAKAGQVTCVMGRNGAGKTTLLRAIMGQIRISAGAIMLNGAAIHPLPAHQVARHGIGYIPQGRRLFSERTVDQNIQVGLMTRHKGKAARDHVLSLFPRLTQRADTLSGGEQQMLAHALCLKPSVLLLDDPTVGLQPSMITRIRDTLTTLKSAGVAIILVEQRVDAVLSMADSIAFVRNGTVAETQPASTLTAAAPQFFTCVGV